MATNHTLIQYRGVHRQRRAETTANRVKNFSHETLSVSLAIHLLSSPGPTLIFDLRSIVTSSHIMSESGDDQYDGGDDGIDRCDVCGETVEEAGELYFCQACQGLTFCSGCWKRQAAHNPRRRSTFSEPLQTAATLHEKTKLSTIKLVRPAFSNAADIDTIETRLAEDANAAWFGESCDIRPLIFSPAKRPAI